MIFYIIYYDIHFIITLLQRAASGTRRLGSGAARRNSSAGSGMYSEEVHVFPILVCLCTHPAYIYTRIRMYMLIYTCMYTCTDTHAHRLVTIYLSRHEYVLTLTYSSLIGL